MNSRSIETLFSLLEVLATRPKDFFDDDKNQRVVYSKDEQTVFCDEEKKYKVRWLVPESIDKEMDPVLLTFEKEGEFKQFDPSSSETFMYVIKDRIQLVLGTQQFIALEGQSLYFEASDHHQLLNHHVGQSQVLIVATRSYL